MVDSHPLQALPVDILRFRSPRIIRFVRKSSCLLCSIQHCRRLRDRNIKVKVSTHFQLRCHHGRYGFKYAEVREWRMQEKVNNSKMIRSS
jgi:hypothetical protein